MASMISPRQRGRYSGYLGAAYALGTVGGPLIQDMPLFDAYPAVVSLDPPDHTIRRRIITRAFTPRAVAKLEDGIRERAKAMAGAGLPDINWATNPTHGLALVSLISIWLNLPFTLILIYAAMLAVPVDLYESATIDGASPATSPLA